MAKRRVVSLWATSAALKDPEWCSAKGQFCGDSRSAAPPVVLPSPLHFYCPITVETALSNTVRWHITPRDRKSVSPNSLTAQSREGPGQDSNNPPLNLRSVEISFARAQIAYNQIASELTRAQTDEANERDTEWPPSEKLFYACGVLALGTIFSTLVTYAEASNRGRVDGAVGGGIACSLALGLASVAALVRVLRLRRAERGELVPPLLEQKAAADKRLRAAEEGFRGTRNQVLHDALTGALPTVLVNMIIGYDESEEQGLSAQRPAAPESAADSV